MLNTDAATVYDSDGMSTEEVRKEELRHFIIET